MTEALVPYTTRTLDDTMTLGKVLAASGYFADSREAAQAVVKVLAGAELGFGPIASMTGVNIIKGKVSLSANLIAAAIKRSGRYNYRVVSLTDTDCRIDFYEAGERVGTSTFTADDAKLAGLGGDNWRKFPRNMLFARAISNGAKWYCPDLSGGPLYTPEELGATIDGETGEVVDVPVVVKPAAAQPAPDQPAAVPFKMTTQGAVEWACRTAPQVWPTNDRDEIVTSVVEASFNNCRKANSGRDSDAIARAWIAKVSDKIATFAASQASETDESAEGDWADTDAHGHEVPQFS